MSLDTIQMKANQQILRSFALPFRGTVLVRTGQEVWPGDVLAEAALPEHYQVFDVVNSFKVKPENLDRYMERLVGEQVKAGDIIAQKPGLFARIFRARQDGMLIALRDGKVSLVLGEKLVQAKANFPGIVVEIIPERGAVVAAEGALLQGVWGNGQDAEGELSMLAQVDEKEAHKDALLGKIAVVDTCSKSRELNQLLEKKPAGLIFGSVSPELLPALERLALPVMILVGFGEFPVDQFSAELLARLEAKTVFLLAKQVDSLSGVRPELIFPDKAEEASSLYAEEEMLHLGAKVRILGKPYSGSVGRVIALPDEVEMFASGLMMRPVVVQRTDEQVIRVPLENLEVIID